VYHSKSHDRLRYSKVQMQTDVHVLTGPLTSLVLILTLKGMFEPHRIFLPDKNHLLDSLSGFLY
jgi:hypothetical protein